MCLGVNARIYECLAVCITISSALHPCICYLAGYSTERSHFICNKDSFLFLDFCGSEPVDIKTLLFVCIFLYCIRLLCLCCAYDQ